MNQPGVSALAASVRLLLVALVAVAMWGCGAARSAGDGPVPPPLDVNRARWDEQFGRLRMQEYQLPAQEEYVIGPGDILGLSLVGRPDILGFEADEEEKVLHINVSEDPRIVLPHVGSIRAHGKTRGQLQEDIRVAYSTVITNPIPILTVEKYYYNTITVLGSVNTPGRYPLEVGDTMLDSIFKAGGVSFGGAKGGSTSSLPPARIAKIYREKASREQRTTLSVEDLIELFRSREGFVAPRDEILVPFDEVILGGQLSYNIPLRPNDIVYVPPAGTVSVQGPFEAPRVVFLGPGLRMLSQVITECGGLQYKAASEIEIIRTYPDGTMESFFVNVRKLMKQQEPDFYLEDNDKIVAYRHGFRAFVDAVGNIFKATASTGVNATYSPV